MIKVTVKEFASKHGLSESDNLMANSVLQFMVRKGIATVEQAPKIEGHKGKPANVFTIPEEIVIKS